MDRWEWHYGRADCRIIECPTCEAVFNLDYIKPYAIDDFRHCPNCGERLDPPKEES